MNAPLQADLMDAPAASAVKHLLEPAPASLPATMPQPTASRIAAPAPGGVSPDYLIQLAMEMGDKDLDRWERLLKMQAEHKAEQARIAFWRDFAAFRGANIVVPLTKDVDRGKAGSFTQAEYHVATQMLSPALSAHGFSFRHDQRFGSRQWLTEGVASDVPWVWVTCFLTHRDGHTEKLELDGPPGELSANNPVQNMQATASYLKRQSLLAITGTATGGEDNENNLRRPRDVRELPSDADCNEFDRLHTEGHERAQHGTKVLTEWWGKLSAKQRSLMNDDFGAMRKAAGQVDKGAGRG